MIILWDRAVKFTRWQHLQWGAGRGLLGLHGINCDVYRYFPQAMKDSIRNKLLTYSFGHAELKNRALDYQHFNTIGPMPYASATFVADLPTMSDRRDQLSRKFSISTLQPILPLYTVFFLPLETNYPSLAYEQPQNSPVSPPEQKI